MTQFGFSIALPCYVSLLNTHTACCLLSSKLLIPHSNPYPSEKIVRMHSLLLPSHSTHLQSDAYMTSQPQGWLGQHCPVTILQHHRCQQDGANQVWRMYPPSMCRTHYWQEMRNKSSAGGHPSRSCCNPAAISSYCGAVEITYHPRSMIFKGGLLSWSTHQQIHSNCTIAFCIRESLSSQRD